MSRQRWARAATLFIALGCVVLRTGPRPLSAAETALDRYIAKPDASYAWKLLATHPGQGQTTYVLELTSQTWRSAKDVDRPVWTHWLTIVRPARSRASHALLFIGGGSHAAPAPTAAAERTLATALGANCMTAELSGVPNQPLRFADSPEQGRSEDDLIAYSRVRYIQSRDEEWLVRLAMVKSAVRAMDAVQEFLPTVEAQAPRIEKFMVAGGSKRGWTTWLTAVVDPRVEAIVPLVIDALNSQQITRHHFEAYGFFSPALQDYVNHKIFPNLIGTPEYGEVLAIEDPYAYRDRPRLRLPKYLINAAGDEFFLPDNSQFYYGELPPEKHLRYVPNAKHSLAGSDARESLQVFCQAVMDGRPRPRYTWRKESNGALRVEVQDRPREVNLWQATNPQARDFRLDTLGPAYTATRLAEQSPGVYLGSVAPPSAGYTAFFVELVYESGYPHPYKFTTGVSVTPDVLPYRWEDALPK
ncbi:MAG: PhoPQ-activated pathogenicity-related family protein [Planctomycetaceae bacterium]|nr:PhoPQ-activated pathogenicity-related family protein [Planctomycetaceae bacterium]